jgi:hypothetical protein
MLWWVASRFLLPAAAAAAGLLGLFDAAAAICNVVGLLWLLRAAACILLSSICTCRNHRHPCMLMGRNRCCGGSVTCTCMLPTAAAAAVESILLVCWLPLGLN